MQNLLFIALGLFLLIVGGNWLLKASVNLSLRLNIPKIVIGMTVVSFVTSTPEMIVSVKSALVGLPDLALGNVVGSNIANIGFVLATTVLLGSINVRKSFYVSDWPAMMVSSLLFLGFIYFDRSLQRYEGIIMVVCLFLFLVYLFRFQKKDIVYRGAENEVLLPLYKMLLFLALGGTALWGGSELLIDGTVGMATFYGISERVIGITIVSVGTSIPELATSIIAVVKKEKAIYLGNIIGSNIFNLLAVMGITSIITPIAVLDDKLLSNDIFWLLGISFFILPMVLISKGRLRRRSGIVLLIAYIIFLYSTVQ